MKIKTTNIGFDNSYNYLLEKYEYKEDFAWKYLLIDLLKLKKRPTRKELVYITTSLINVILIGKRNDWITFHVDGKGRPTYLCLKNEVIKERRENENT